ncbi:MAG: DUF433 domain-containing protein [Chloroflexi bacterium]|nr:DUF433 domain-containing protein [Chloroflexota bacterium]
MSLLAGRIVREIGVLGGRPHIRNTRVPVSVILGGLAEGMSPEELTRAFPPLTLEDIRATLAYAAIEFALTH